MNLVWSASVQVSQLGDLAISTPAASHLFVWALQSPAITVSVNVLRAAMTCQESRWDQFCCIVVYGSHKLVLCGLRVAVQLLVLRY